MSYNNSALYDYNLLSLLSRENLKIYYFGSIYYNAQPIRHINIYKVFKYNKIGNNIIKAISYLMSLLTITWHVAVKHPSVIHIQWIKIPYVDKLFIGLWKYFGCVIVYTAHNVMPHGDERISTKNQYKIIYRIVNCILTHSDITKEEISHEFNVDLNKLFCIPHGLIDMPANNNQVKLIKADLTAKYNLQNKIVFSSLGFQEPYKGTKFLLDVWNDTKELNENKTIHLIIAGKFNNINYDFIKNKFANVTIIDRRITDEEYVAILNLTNVILLPYIKISQSGVLMSALSTRIPILVSNVGGLPEPLKIANVGWNIGHPNKQNLSSTLKYLVNHPDDIYGISNSIDSWNRVNEYYSWERNAIITNKIYIMYDNKK